MGISLRLLQVIPVIALVSGCAAWSAKPSTNSGNHTTVTPEVNAQLAADSFQRVAALYPPAQTTIAFHTPTVDAFGLALSDQLRLAGYAVVLPNPASTLDLPAGVPLTYLVAEIGKAEYRVMLGLNNDRFSRAYVQTPQGLHSASFWTRKVAP